MPRDIDPRTVVGGKVHALACHVTSEAETKRVYGSNWKSATVNGTVLEVRKRTKANNKNLQTYVYASYMFPSEVSRSKELHLKSVKKFWPTDEPATTTVPPPIQVGPTIDPPIPPPAPPAPPAQWESPTANQQPTNAAMEKEIESFVTDVTVNYEQQPTTPLPNPPPPQQLPIQPPAAAPPQPTINPALCPHGTEWEEASCIPEVNGFVPKIDWAITTTMGEMIGPTNYEKAAEWTRFDTFMQMFPRLHLMTIVRETNFELNKKQEKMTTSEEIIKLFGILILITRFEFGSRASLWSAVQQFKYIPTASLGRTGMSRNRFDILFSCLRFSKHPEVRPHDMSSEAWRWTLVDDFVKAFNDHCERHFVPSELICVDESISRWYGQGGHWINAGLPCYEGKG